MQHKRSKNSRMKGRETHGHGSSKKHRGSGERGGKGNAGSGKRGGAKRMRVSGGVKEYFGKRGFNSHNTLHINPVNIDYIQKSLNTLVERGVVKKEKDLYVLDLADIGANKLLAKGPVNFKFRITAEYASQGAIDKVKEASGEVILPGSEEKTE